MLFLKDRYEENVLRFDNLSKDLAEFGERHGIDIRNLPRQNESEMPRFSVEDLDETTRLMIETIFAKDFDLLGFKRKATGRRDMWSFRMELKTEVKMHRKHASKMAYRAGNLNMFCWASRHWCQINP